MANGVIDINFTTIDSCASRIAQEIEFIQTKINDINNCYSSLDSRVKQQLGSPFDTSELETIKTRLEKTQTFLGEVKKVYSGADIDLSDSLSVDYLEYLYPYFHDLSDDRKAIVLSALRYLGLNANQMGYAKNFSSQYASSQFIGNATEHAWCAMFVGSIINYYYGDQSIIDPSYASVWKIIGNYNGQTGIAFETDDRIHYYVSQALVDKYKRNGGFSNWETNLSKYNAEHGTNLKVSDWINDCYIPQQVHILTFKQGNRYYTSKKDAPLSDYNEAVERSRAAFFADNDSSDYPNDPQSYTHIGFVLGTREVDGVTYVDTVEGNVNDDVQVRSFRIDDPYLVGYGHIDYEKFSSDKEAIQRMISTGVDTTASKATAQTMSQHLLALHNGDLKGNYLVNLASNIDVVGAQNLVVTEEPVTGQITTIATTTTGDNSIVTTQEPVTSSGTGSETVTTTTTHTTTGGSHSYSQPVYQTTTTHTQIPTAVAVAPTQTSTTPVTTPSVVEQIVSVSTPEVVTAQPAPVQETPVYVPSVSSTETVVVQPTTPPVTAHIVEDTPATISTPLEDVSVPFEEDEFGFEMGRNDDWDDLEPQDDYSIQEESIPSDAISYENTAKSTPTTSPKSGSNFGKIALATLGVGAAAGGAVYIAQKAKKNNDTGEAEEEESEEEYSDEY